ncbi:DeoR/GlpR family DNA-binding transcription regulator [Clostridium brassicae]|uniref:DeoR/GlpR family DNA-binding transcription regulator n=1 Tax=Clostridium brassicae TaxID=2999072 RepID=A0ABT4D4E3_9CLOT|nr:DeoR/GlpR family DNA-binding transcription regulator [Clostridium brassicae]MCY6957147.1 DeoR/GlpR family DNA-binding transcription regulator [Clostridium brassicae]
MKINRIKKIEAYLIKHESASLDTLCEIFNVSKNTIRRDVSELEKKGIIKKVYGGVTVTNKKSTIPFAERQISNLNEKKLIGKLASELVEDRDIIFIDSGTTTLQMVPFLKNKQNLTIITNNLVVIQEAIAYDNLNILSTGGTLYRNTSSFVGIETLNFLKQYNISKAFMAASGISISKGITNSSPLESEIKRTMVENSDKVFILADSSKVDIVSLMTYCSIKEIDALITDKIPSKDFSEFFKANNVDLLTPNNK